MNAVNERLLWPWWSQSAMDATSRLLEGGDLAAAGARHEQIEACEQLAAQQLAAGRAVMMVDCGTGALETGYAALGLERGGEVLVASHSFRATVTAMLPRGLVPVLCDADPDSGGIDLRDAARHVTARTVALVITHTWGRPVPLDAARALADRHHLALIEDCSHAHGTQWCGRPVGTTADVAIWSTGTTKMVTGGRGGLLSARDRQVWQRAMVLAQPKHRAQLVEDPALRALAATGVGHNRRAYPLAAVLAADHLRRLPHTLATKGERQTAVEALLHRHLPALTPLPAPAGRTAGALYKWHWRAGPSLPAIGDVVRALRAAGIRANAPARPLHEAPLFTDPDLGRALGLPRLPATDPGSYPGTGRLLQRLVEIDTRDMYDPLPEGDPDPYAAALVSAAKSLRTSTDRSVMV
ncbi:DegT/DnrJ/EryC1/StrS family aminotransferase [Streptomyces xiamenensis]|uniref:DegT/DnrJ/EryC1/StrS family aminotransferase n=1 Tax=Streptomyces xiamenensis TaxID=408015 RepID=UPI0035DE44EA